MFTQTFVRQALIDFKNHIELNDDCEVCIDVADTEQLTNDLIDIGESRVDSGESLDIINILFELLDKNGLEEYNIYIEE